MKPADKLQAAIRSIPDFPKPGIIYRDITPILKDVDLLSLALRRIAAAASSYEFDVIAGPESRGFIFGVPLALQLGKGFIPIRKAGKLPFSTYSKSYALEYGQATIEIHTDAVEPGQKVLIVDDLLATGGTSKATIELFEEIGAKVSASVFLIELQGLGGRAALEHLSSVQSVIQY